MYWDEPYDVPIACALTFDTKILELKPYCWPSKQREGIKFLCCRVRVLNPSSCVPRFASVQVKSVSLDVLSLWGRKVGGTELRKKIFHPDDG